MGVAGLANSALGKKISMDPEEKFQTAGGVSQKRESGEWSAWSIDQMDLGTVGMYVCMYTNYVPSKAIFLPT